MKYQNLNIKKINDILLLKRITAEIGNLKILTLSNIFGNITQICNENKQYFTWKLFLFNSICVCRQGHFYMFREHEPHVVQERLVCQHHQFGTDFLQMFIFLTVSLVLNQDLQYSYFKPLILIVRP